MTSIIAAGSSPNCLPTRNASLAAANDVPARKLFSAFMAWPQPSEPTSNSLRSHARQHRLDRRDGAGLAADHDRERAVLGARHAARYRRVHQGDLSRRKLAAKLAGADRCGRTHVDDEAAGSQAFSQGPAIGFQQSVAHFTAARQHGDDGV